MYPCSRGRDQRTVIRTPHQALQEHHKYHKTTHDTLSKHQAPTTRSLPRTGEPISALSDPRDQHKDLTSSTTRYKLIIPCNKKDSKQYSEQHRERQQETSENTQSMQETTNTKLSPWKDEPIRLSLFLLLHLQGISYRTNSGFENQNSPILVIQKKKKK